MTTNPTIRLLQQALTAYLQRHFQTVEIRQSQRTHKDDGTAFLVHAEQEDYTVIITDDAIADNATAEDLAQNFEQYNLANVMRDLIGFAVTVTDSGCIFEN